MENYVFVTGADGMLGSMVCRELLSGGYAVKALVLNKRKAFNRNNLELECCEGNVLDGDFIQHATRGAKYIIHTAALTTFWPRKAKLVMDVNLNGTFNVMNAVLKNRISRMVHIGTACSFSAQEPNHPGNEENFPAVDRNKSDYIRSKLLAQNMLLDAYRRKDLPVLILNPTFMIGPFDSGPNSGTMIQSYCRKKIPGCSSGGKNFVYSGDVAAAAVMR